MGNCVPAQKTTESAAMNLKSQENRVHIESPIKEDKVNGDLSMVELNSQLQFSTPLPCEASNREEMFFDSQSMIDSDIENFLSVNGDCTPLGGNTPIHQSNLVENPQCDESLYISSNEKSIPETSPTDMRKQLIEFFHESFDNDVDTNQNLQDKVEAKSIAFYLPSKCRNRNPHDSICSAKGKTEHSAQCCLPNLVRSLSFNERKKRLSSVYK